MTLWNRDNLFNELHMSMYPIMHCLLWSRLFCDHGWIRSGPVDVRQSVTQSVCRVVSQSIRTIYIMSLIICQRFLLQMLLGTPCTSLYSAQVQIQWSPVSDLIEPQVVDICPSTHSSLAAAFCSAHANGSYVGVLLILYAFHTYHVWTYVFAEQNAL